MAEVYEVDHVSTRRKHALKILRPNVCETDIRHFWLEARIEAQLRHQNIVGCSDAGVTPDGRPWLVMELLTGPSGRQIIDKGPIPIPLALDIGAQVATALDAVHRHGITHRDVKPENIHVVRGGLAKLGDFGLVQVVSELAAEEEAPGYYGTPLYMSPEQLLGRDVDGRSDVYSAALVTSELILGRPVRTFGPGRLLSNGHALHLVMRPSLSLARRIEGFPEYVSDILDRGLAEDPRDRWTANELRTELRTAAKRFELDFPPNAFPVREGAPVHFPCFDDETPPLELRGHLAWIDVSIAQQILQPDARPSEEPSDDAVLRSVSRPTHASEEEVAILNDFDQAVDAYFEEYGLPRNDLDLFGDDRGEAGASTPPPDAPCITLEQDEEDAAAQSDSRASKTPAETMGPRILAGGFDSNTPQLSVPAIAFAQSVEAAIAAQRPARFRGACGLGLARFLAARGQMPEFAQPNHAGPQQSSAEHGLDQETPHRVVRQRPDDAHPETVFATVHGEEDVDTVTDPVPPGVRLAVIPGGAMPTGAMSSSDLPLRERGRSSPAPVWDSVSTLPDGVVRRASIPSHERRHRSDVATLPFGTLVAYRSPYGTNLAIAEPAPAVEPGTDVAPIHHLDSCVVRRPLPQSSAHRRSSGNDDVVCGLPARRRGDWLRSAVGDQEISLRSSAERCQMGVQLAAGPRGGPISPERIARMAESLRSTTHPASKVVTQSSSGVVPLPRRQDLPRRLTLAGAAGMAVAAGLALMVSVSATVDRLASPRATASVGQAASTPAATPESTRVPEATAHGLPLESSPEGWEAVWPPHVEPVPLTAPTLAARQAASEPMQAPRPLQSVQGHVVADQKKPTKAPSREPWVAPARSPWVAGKPKSEKPCSVGDYSPQCAALVELAVDDSPVRRSTPIRAFANVPMPSNVRSK